MIKKLLIVLICIFSYQIHAQDGTASPYSFYGIGTLKFKGTVENRSMGGLSIYNDSIHVNLRNPASYTGPNLMVFNNETRPVKFTVSGSYNSLKLKGQSSSVDASTTTFNYMAFNFPIGKFGVGLGILPFTSVGYKLESTRPEDDLIDNRYRGEGGLNKAFAGLGYRINDKLSVGFDLSYNFGNTQNSVVAFIYDDEGNPVEYQTRENNRSDLSGFSANFGVTYTSMLNDDLEFTSSLTYSPISTLTSDNARSISTINYIEESQQEIVVNTIEVDLDEQNLKSTDLSLPSRLAFGAGLGKPRKWFVGAEYTRRNTSEFSNPIFAIEEANFVDANGIAVGGFFIPDYNSFSKYWKRVTYRAGIHFENTGLNIKGEDINEFGMSFGIGLPVGMYFSNANLGFELGRRGTTDQNLIQENYINFQISLSLNDRWFEKRKYD